MWLSFWWQVRIPLLTVSLPVLVMKRTTFADVPDGSTLLAFLFLGLALDSFKQFLESRNIKVNTKADQDGVRKAAIVSIEGKCCWNEGLRLDADVFHCFYITACP